MSLPGIILRFLQPSDAPPSDAPQTPSTVPNGYIDNSSRRRLNPYCFSDESAVCCEDDGVPSTWPNKKGNEKFHDYKDYKSCQSCKFSCIWVFIMNFH